MIRVQLTSLDQLEVQIEEIEERIAAALKPSPEVKLLRTVPGIGEILAPLIWLEVGDIERFPRAENLASYAGLVPRIHASGGRIRHGGTCRNVNQYLKWGIRRGRHLLAADQGLSRHPRRTPHFDRRER